MALPQTPQLGEVGSLPLSPRTVSPALGPVMTDDRQQTDGRICNELPMTYDECHLKSSGGHILE